MSIFTGLQIKTASLEDWPCIAELQEICFPGDPTQIFETEYHELVAGQGGSVFVARADRCFAGHIIMRRRGLLPWESIAFMAVDARFRGRGLGTMLTQIAAKNAHRPFMRLHVRPSNIAALSVYRRQGFRVIGRKEANYEDGEDALIMMCWNGLPISKATVPNDAGDVAA